MSLYHSPADRALTEHRSLLQPKRPGFWLMAILLGIGGALAIPSMVSTVSTNPIAAGLALVSVTVFGVLVVGFLLVLGWLDPKPASVGLGAFALGALVTTTFSQLVSVPLNHLFESVISSDALAGAFAAATGEELYKALAVVVIFLVAPWWWNRIIDGFIIGALVGLGFQLWEDVVYVATGSGQATPDFQQSLTILFDRVLLHGLASHAAYTALFGAALAYAVARSGNVSARVGVVLVGFLAAWSAHALWDAPFLGELASSQAGLIAYTAIKSLPAVIVLLVVGRAASRELRTDFGAAAQPELGGALTNETLEPLTTWRGRRSASTGDHGHHVQQGRRDLVRLHLHGLVQPAVLSDQRTFLSQLESGDPSHADTSS